jgi:hypothetical protein
MLYATDVPLCCYFLQYKVSGGANTIIKLEVYNRKHTKERKICERT